MLHIRNEHDAVEYVVNHLKGYPYITEALESDSYVYYGYCDKCPIPGLVIVVTTLHSKHSYLVKLTLYKPPRNTEIHIHDMEKDDAGTTKHSSTETNTKDTT